MLPVPLAGTPGMERGAGGWKAPGERGPWGARPLGGSWRERVAKALMREPWASRGPLTRPTEPPPQGRAPLPAPGGGPVPRGGSGLPGDALLLILMRLPLSVSLSHLGLSVSPSHSLLSLCLGGKPGVMSGPSSPAGAPGDAGCRRLLSRHPWLMEGSGNSGSGRGKTWHPEPRPPPPWGCCAAPPRGPQQRSACLAGPGLPGNDKGDAVISSETSHPAALS